MRDNIYLVNVVARAADGSRVSLDTLATLQVPVPGGRTVALGQFANFSFGQEQPFIWRRDRLPTLTVLADVANGDTPEAAVAALEPQIAEMNAALPVGYEIQVGGTVETSADSSASVFAVVPLMIFLMITLLMVQLKNFKDMAMVVILLPLGLIGVVAALLAFGRPLGFVAILGILALIGMIAKNAVDPDHPDHRRACGRKNGGRGGGLGGDGPFAAASADGTVDRAGHAAHRADAVLGTDGLCDHGGPDGGNASDAGPFAHDLRDASWRQPRAARDGPCLRRKRRLVGLEPATSEATTACSSGYVLALFATGIATVALALLAFDLAGDDSGAVIGTALSIKMLAYVFAAPLVTILTDRLPRRSFLIALDLIRAG